MREIGNVTILCRSIHLASSSIEWAGKPENRFLSKISNSAADPPIPPLTGFGHIAAQHKAVLLLLLLRLGFRVWHIKACHIYVWALINCTVFFSGLCCKLWFFLTSKSFYNVRHVGQQIVYTDILMFFFPF